MDIELASFIKKYILKKEVIVGIIVLLVLIGGTYLLTKVKQSGILSRQVKLYALTEEAYHLKVGQFIYYSGMEIGRVSEIESVPNAHKKYIVGLNLHTNVSLPSNTRAEITYISVMGGREVNLIPDSTMPVTGYLQSGDTITAYITSIPTQIEDFLLPFKKQMDKFFLKYPMDTLEQMFYELKASAAAYNAKTAQYVNTLRQKAPSLNQSLLSYRNMSQEWNKKMPQYMKELQKLNAQLQVQTQKGIDKNIEHTTQQIEQFSQTVAAQNPTIEKANTQIDSVQAKLKTIPQQPTWKKYVEDEKLPAQMHQKVNTTQSAIRNLYENPKEVLRLKD